MEKINLTWLPKKTFEVVVCIPWSEICKSRETFLKEAGETMEIKGFRKGKAPTEIVMENIDKQKLLESVLNKTVPACFQEAILKNNLKPIISPQIELLSAKEGEEWQIKFISCEAPDVVLGDYKKELSKENSSGKIWKPGESLARDKDDKATNKREEKLQKTIEWLIKNIKIDFSDLLIDSEIKNKLSQLLNQTQKLGITVEQYFASTNKTIESIKDEYRQQVKKNLTIEFVLQKIADLEKIEVKDEDIQKLISSAKTEEEKASLEKDKYYLASLIRQQKTLDFLVNL